MAIKGMFVPEGIIEDRLQLALDYIRKEYREAADKSKTVLGYIASDQRLGKYEYGKELVKGLITTAKEPRHIEIKQSYDPNDRTYPGIYLNLADEEDQNSSIGQGVGDHQFVGDQAIFDDDGNEVTDIYSKRYTARYYLTILSDNKNETIGLYHFFKMLLITIGQIMELEGMQNFKVSGKGNTFDSRIPTGIHLRVITISLNYEAYSPDFYANIIPAFGGVTSSLISE